VPAGSPATVLEAESAQLRGAVVSRAVAGYTGTGFVDYLNATSDYVQWSVNVPTAGAYSVGFRYANGSAADRPLELAVNGLVVQSRVALPVTGAWTNWRSASALVTLAAGANTVRLTAVGFSGPNVDSLTVTAATA
jgi:hypothetical protein